MPSPEQYKGRWGRVGGNNSKKGYRGNNAREEGTIQGKGGNDTRAGGGQHRKEQYKGRGGKQYKGGRGRRRTIQGRGEQRVVLPLVVVVLFTSFVDS